MKGNTLKASKVASEIRYKDWEIYVSTDESYLQVRFLSDGLNQLGRKWKLSEHMTKSEVVQTALAAVLAAEEHEARENFTYCGRNIFNPHLNVIDLVELVDRASSDVREVA